MPKKLTRAAVLANADLCIAAIVRAPTDSGGIDLGYRRGRSGMTVLAEAAIRLILREVELAAQRRALDAAVQQALRIANDGGSASDVFHALYDLRHWFTSHEVAGHA